MKNAKDAVREILDELPDTTTLEDIQYQIYLRQKVERGLQEIRDGQGIDQGEIEREFAG